MIGKELLVCCKPAELKDKAKSMDKFDTFSAETGAISDAQL